MNDKEEVQKLKPYQNGENIQYRYFTFGESQTPNPNSVSGLYNIDTINVIIN